MARKNPGEPNVEVLSIDDLISDPANPRAHPEKNRKAVAGSVRRFKPWRSIAIDQGNVIYAGNETANACKEAGFTEVLVIEPRPGQLVAVRRSDMTETEKTGYAIADNQVALSAEWVPELPAALASLELDGFDLDCLGFDEDELKGLLNHPENGIIADGDWPEQGTPDSHSIVLRYRNEDGSVLLRFLGESDGSTVLTDGRAGEKLLARIREVAQG